MSQYEFNNENIPRNSTESQASNLEKKKKEKGRIGIPEGKSLNGEEIIEQDRALKLALPSLRANGLILTRMLTRLPSKGGSAVAPEQISRDYLDNDKKGGTSRFAPRWLPSAIFCYVAPLRNGAPTSRPKDCSFLLLLAFHAPRIMLPRFRASVVNGGEGVGTWQLDTFRNWRKEI